MQDLPCITDSAMAEITVPKLMAQYGISDAACDATVTELHMMEIIKKYGSRWKEMYMYLDIDKITVSDLKYAPGDEEDKRQCFFGIWKQQKGNDATYRALLTALLGVTSRDDAECVCKLMQGQVLSAAQCPSNGRAAYAVTSNGNNLSSQATPST